MTRDQELKQAGLKVTGPRVKILKLLESSEASHLSAEAVYQQLKAQNDEVGLATVYRVLGQFETAGLVIRHNFENEHAVYELNQGEHHDHIVCVKCGVVKEFTDPIIEERQTALTEAAGFEMTDHSLIIYGVCSGCSA